MSASLQTVTGAPLMSRAIIVQLAPTRSIVMNPNVLLATMLATTAPGAGVADTGNGVGKRASSQSPPLPETTFPAAARWTKPNDFEDGKRLADPHRLHRRRKQGIRLQRLQHRLQPGVPGIR